MLCKGGDFILELIFKGLLQWLFDMIINITEYLANSLLTIFTMDLSYFERNVPVTADIVNIMVCTGWALLLGNLVYQATKSMATGLGFEGEDPRELFSRTFVMGFLLVASRQVCDIGLSITKKVIDLLQVPSTVQMPSLTEDLFDVPGDASWLLVIIFGVILIIQLIKLFFEIGERYVIVSVLTILSPLAFAMGGSKNTADIFKGWVRMFASMCLMMVLSVVFLKFMLSAMSDVPSGAAVLPWTIFVVALAKAGRKVDGLIARIGLSPAITGDPLGHSRMPGMLTYMVIRNMTGSMGRAAAVSGATAGKVGASKSVLSAGSSSHTSTPVRPPIGGGAATSRDGSASSPVPSAAASPSGHTAHGTPKPAEAATRMDSALPASMPIREAGASTVTSPKGTHVTGTAATPGSRPPISTPAPSKDISGAGKSATGRAASTVLTAGASTDTAMAATPVSTKSAADIKSADKPKSGAATGASATSSRTGIPVSKATTDIPLADKIRPAMSADSPSVKTAKDGLSKAGRTTRPVAAGTGMLRENASTAKTTPWARPSDASVVNKAGGVNQKGGNVTQNQSNATNISVSHKAGAAAPSRPDVTSVRGEQGKPPVGKLPHGSVTGISATNSALSSKLPLSAPGETPKSSAIANIETTQAAHGKGASEPIKTGNAKSSYKNASSRPESVTTKNMETSKHSVTAGNMGSSTGSGTPTKLGVTSVSSASATSAHAANTTTMRTEKSISKQPPTSQASLSRPTAPKTNGSVAREKPVNTKQKQTSKETGDNADNNERLRTRPPYKASGSTPKGGNGKHNER